MVSTILDKIAQPHIQLLNRSRSAFHVCGWIGLVSANLLVMALATSRGLSPWVMEWVVAISVIAFLVIAMVTKIISGRETLTYYHHAVLVTITSAMFLWMSGNPVLHYLDVMVLGLGMFVAFGRVGCLMVGCCHGRPHPWGVCYTSRHVDEGFPTYLAGIRLFPVQAVESIGLFLIVAYGSILVLTGSPPGTALAWYVVAYGFIRFILEFLRGDTARSYQRGFSEAQWTSILLVLGIASAEFFTFLPYSWLDIILAGSVVLIFLIITVKRIQDGALQTELLKPNHLREIAQVIRSSTATRPDETQVVSTSLGICISVDHIQIAGQTTCLYTLSARQETMNRQIAETLARHLVILGRHEKNGTLLESENQVYHFVIQPVER